MKFFVDMIPPTTTAQEQKFAKTPRGKYIVYKHDKLIAAQELLTMSRMRTRPGTRTTMAYDTPTPMKCMD